MKRIFFCLFMSVGLVFAQQPPARVQDPDKMLHPAARHLLQTTLDDWHQAVGLDFYLEVRRQGEKEPGVRADELIQQWVKQRVGGVFIYDLERRGYAATFSPGALELVSESELSKILLQALQEPALKENLDVTLLALLQGAAARLTEAQRADQRHQFELQQRTLAQTLNHWKLAACGFLVLALIAGSGWLLSSRKKLESRLAPPPEGVYYRTGRRKRSETKGPGGSY